ncbi:hypothetical protein JL721_9902 [Aureococcus anophagefferens]|nr:hypothetical protein JL721_9902 [Aureococcus anophagefferens]
MRLHLAGMLALCRALQRASVPRSHLQRRGLRATVATPPPAAPDAGVAAQVEAQGALIRDLKEGQGLGNKSPEVVAAVAELVRLKALLEPPPDTGGDATEAYAELRGRRLAKAEAMRAAGVEPFAYGFEASHSAAAAQAEWAGLENGAEDEGARVSVCGRLMAKRVFGKKLAFFGLRDATGEIQLFLEKKRVNGGLGDGDPKTFKNLLEWTDGGDVVGASGTVKRTDKGELSVYVDDWTMLTKALAPLPDKHKGLVDVQTRYRRRELDLIANPDVRRTFELRAKITRGAEAKPFETKHNALDLDLTLRIATELHLKRLVVGGFDRVYELGRIFRNEGVSTRHNPEFTSVELYQAYADYDDMMVLTETLVESLAENLVGTTQLPYADETIDVSAPWRRVTMSEVVRDAGVDFEGLDLDEAKAAAKAAGVPAALADKQETLGYLLNCCFEELCEASLRQPTFVTDYPVEISPLAKPHRSKPGLVERFELFCVGRELANAYSELTDPVDQRARFEAQAAKKAAGDDEACGVDEDFLAAVEHGLPPTGGLGIGIDRLANLPEAAWSSMSLVDAALMRKKAPSPQVVPQDSATAPSSPQNHHFNKFA